MAEGPQGSTPKTMLAAALGTVQSEPCKSRTHAEWRGNLRKKSQVVQTRSAICWASKLRL